MYLHVPWPKAERTDDAKQALSRVCDVVARLLHAFDDEPAQRGQSCSGSDGNEPYPARLQTVVFTRGSHDVATVQVAEATVPPEYGMWSASADVGPLTTSDGESVVVRLSATITNPNLELSVRTGKPTVLLEVADAVAAAVGAALPRATVLLQAELSASGGRRPRPSSDAMVAYLRERGVELTPADRARLVYEAARRGDPETLARRLTADIDLAVVASTYDAPPLHGAIAGLHETAVRQLVAAGAPPDGTDASGRTALILAVSSGTSIPQRTTLARVLVELGADVEATTPGGDTPLVAAVRSCSMERGLPLVTTLLELGADPARVPAGGQSAIECAEAWGRPPSVQQALLANAGD